MWRNMPESASLLGQVIRYVASGDGAGAAHRFLDVTLPPIMPVMKVVITRIGLADSMPGLLLPLSANAFGIILMWRFSQRAPRPVSRPPPQSECPPKSDAPRPA